MRVANGLAKIDSPQGMIVAYATQAGRTADDGQGRNSPYTGAFLKHIEQSEEIGTVFRRISTDVYNATKRTQLPELSLSVIGEFYLKGKSAGATQVAAIKPGPLSGQPFSAVLKAKHSGRCMRTLPEVARMWAARSGSSAATIRTRSAGISCPTVLAFSS